MSPERAARRMIALLEAERLAAGRGDLADLAAMAAHKERLAAVIEAEDGGAPAIAPDTLKALRAALERTAPLLEAVVEGMRSARARAAERAAPLRTYGRDGRAGAVTGAARGPVRRA